MAMSQEEIKQLIGNKENITIFEIGCADGVDTKKFLNTFDSNLKIYTFDPEPINIKYMTTLGSKDAWNGSNDILVTDQRHKFFPYAISGNDGVTKFNDMILDFHHNCSDFACSIQCIDRKEVCKPTTIESGVSEPIKTIKLSELINKEGYDTYIIIACRSLPKDLPKDIPQLHRNISDNYQEKMKEKKEEE